MPLSFEFIFLSVVATLSSSGSLLNLGSLFRNLEAIWCFEEMRGCCSIATCVPIQCVTQRGQASAVVNSLQWRKLKGVIIEESKKKSSKKKSSKLKYRNRFVV